MDEMMKKYVEKYYLPLALEERQKADEAEREADEAEREADEAERRADEAKREADEAERRADEAKREADEAKRRADEIAEDFARFLLKTGHSLEETAKHTRLTIPEIQEIAAQLPDQTNSSFS